MEKKKKSVKLDKKWFIPFIAVILLVSSTWIIVNKKEKVQVKGIQKHTEIPIPLNSTKVSEDTTNKQPEIVYTTKLSKNQIEEFYRSYAKLTNWTSKGDNKYEKEGALLVFKVEETKGKEKESIVKVKIE